MNIYISSSWKNREQVRELAITLRGMGHEVYDFTDQRCRRECIIPPESNTEQFDPAMHKYSRYINREEWKRAVMENKRAIERSDLIVLLLPCGADSHADWALGVGMGKKSVVVGQPQKGERSPVHHWADRIIDSAEEFIYWIDSDTLIG